MSRALLYQCTPALEIFSTGPRVAGGPSRNGDPSRTHSLLYSPIVVTASALSEASPTVPIDPASPASIRVSANRSEVYWDPASEWWMAPAVTGWPRRRSWAAAWRIARLMNAVVLLREHSQPRMVPA